MKVIVYRRADGATAICHLAPAPDGMDEADWLEQVRVIAVPSDATDISIRDLADVPQDTPHEALRPDLSVDDAVVTALTVEQFRIAIQMHVDGIAKSRDYNDGVTLASYDTISQPCAEWRADAAAFVTWRTAVWLYTYAELDKAKSGERPIPTVEAFLAELPAMTWPSPA